MRGVRAIVLPAVHIDEAGERGERVEHRHEIRDLERRAGLWIPQQIALENEAPVHRPARVRDRQDAGRAIETVPAPDEAGREREAIAEWACREHPALVQRDTEAGDGRRPGDVDHPRAEQGPELPDAHGGVAEQPDPGRQRPFEVGVADAHRRGPLALFLEPLRHTRSAGLRVERDRDRGAPCGGAGPLLRRESQGSGSEVGRSDANALERRTVTDRIRRLQPVAGGDERRFGCVSRRDSEQEAHREPPRDGTDCCCAEQGGTTPVSPHGAAAGCKLDAVQRPRRLGPGTLRGSRTAANDAAVSAKAFVCRAVRRAARRDMQVDPPVFGQGKRVPARFDQWALRYSSGTTCTPCTMTWSGQAHRALAFSP